MRWMLVQEDFQGSEAITIDLTDKRALLIGTDPQCDLVVDKELYPSISRRHAVLEFKPSAGRIGKWYLTDNQSTNGTYINLQRLLGSHPIMQDDTVTLSINCLILKLVLVEDVSDESNDLNDGQPSTMGEKSSNSSFNQMLRSTNSSPCLLDGIPEVDPINTISQQHQIQAINSETKGNKTHPNRHDQAIGLQSRVDNSRVASAKNNSSQRSLSRSLPSASIPTLLETGATEQQSFKSTDDIRAVAIDSSRKQMIFASSAKTVIRGIDSELSVHERINDPKNPVNLIRFSCDGHKIALGLKDKSICIMNSKLDRELHLFKGHRMALSDISFSPDGTHLVSCALDKTIRIWDLESGCEEKSIPYQGLIQSIDYTACSKFILAAGRDRIIRRINPDLSNGVETVFKMNSGVEFIRCTESGLVATVCSDKTLRIFSLDDTTQPKLVAKYADRKCIVSICSKSRLFACVDSDNTVHIWSLMQ